MSTQCKKTNSKSRPARNRKDCVYLLDRTQNESKMKSATILEKDLQRLVVEYLRWSRYIVVEIGKTRASVLCRRCGNSFAPGGWQGNTPGAPDLFVTKAGWQARWIAIELKSEKTRLTKQQQELADAGHVYICRSLEDVLHVLKEESLS
jgi:hypothetical protein